MVAMAGLLTMCMQHGLPSGLATLPAESQACAPVPVPHVPAALPDFAPIPLRRVPVPLPDIAPIPVPRVSAEGAGAVDIAPGCMLALADKTCDAAPATSSAEDGGAIDRMLDEMRKEMRAAPCKAASPDAGTKGMAKAAATAVRPVSAKLRAKPAASIPSVPDKLYPEHVKPKVQTCAKTKGTAAKGVKTRAEVKATKTATKGSSTPKTNKLQQGCGKCRGALKGCAQCRDPAFSGKRFCRR